MEKKTIGGFIAALRKASGMTQKDLAERLHVSDKTISRWERDDGTPDLSAIPVIAEIFGVTCDELLRGQRRPPEERVAQPAEAASPARGEKQRRHLLKLAYSQYQRRTYVAAGICGAGVIMALMGNLVFFKAALGFLLGALFLIASVVLQAVFINRAFLCVEDADVDPWDLSAYKRKVIRLAQLSIAVAVAAMGFTSPLLMAGVHVGLSAESMLLFGLGGAALSLLLYAVFLYFFNASLLKRGVYTLSEKEAALYHRNHRRKRKYAIILSALMAVTFLVHQAATTIYGPWSIMEGTTFHNYGDFVAYMEQEVPPQQGPGGLPSGQAELTEESDSAVYYDEYGNEISREEALTRRLKDSSGNVVCQYLHRNQQVVSLRYTPQEGTVLPITVYTQEDLQKAQETAAVRHVLFGAIYGAEIIAVLLVYWKRRAK